MPIDSGEFGTPGLGFFELFSIWVSVFYLHAAVVILVTVYRLLRRLLYEQPKAERMREEKLDLLLNELVALREDLRQRLPMPNDMASRPAIGTGHLDQNAADASREWELIEESQPEAGFHGGGPQRY